MQYDLFVSCPKGLEYLLEAELKALGFDASRVSPQGVYGKASLQTIYQVCLWSRLANRVQWLLLTGPVHDEKTVRALCERVEWDSLFSVQQSFAISFHGTNEWIRNTMFGAQLVKDGIVDYFQRKMGQRPNVDKLDPQIRIHAYLKSGTLALSFDLSGESLHQRGYRLKGGPAPIKENIAAALLLRAKWPQLLEAGNDFHDPFCGSGTLVIEAAMIAANLAPGLLRTSYGFMNWLAHDASLWEQTKQAARAQARAVSITLLGTDADETVIQFAKQNAERAGVGSFVTFERKSLNACKPSKPQGLVACNPPYGERLGDEASLMPLYQTLGQVLHEQYQGWSAAVLTESATLARAIGLRSNKQYTLYNGPLCCQLYCFQLDERNHLNRRSGEAPAPQKTVPAIPLSAGAQMLANRLLKNRTHLLKWAKRLGIEAFRVYDADLPEYAFALDCYKDHWVLQEYMPPKTISEAAAELHRTEMMQAVLQGLGVPPDQVVLKRRQSQKGLAQYEKLDQKQEKQLIREGNAQIWVNLYDYLDTGLFLDHRLLRLEFARLPKGCRFLNLCCYTAVASVHAALAGALTTNVDLSNTYLQWAIDNFKANQLNLATHQFIAADLKTWLLGARQHFDVIFLDPPTFSNSKKMEGVLDVQRDHEQLIDAAMKLLTPHGILYFSTNLRKFQLEDTLRSRYQVEDITPKTIDVDFKKQPKIHVCYRIVAADSK